MDWNSSFEQLPVPLNATVEEDQRMVPKPCSESCTLSMTSGAVHLEDNVSGDTPILVVGNAGATFFTEEMNSEMKASDLETVVRKVP